MKRWGEDRTPLALPLTVEHHEVTALLNERDERGLLVPYACDRRAATG